MPSITQWLLVADAGTLIVLGGMLYKGKANLDLIPGIHQSIIRFEEWRKVVDKRLIDHEERLRKQEGQ